jgi:hypothetical protein
MEECESADRSSYVPRSIVIAAIWACNTTPLQSADNLVHASSHRHSEISCSSSSSSTRTERSSPPLYQSRQVTPGTRRMISESKSHMAMFCGGVWSSPRGCEVEASGLEAGWPLAEGTARGEWTFNFPITWRDELPHHPSAPSAVCAAR